jgi:hypothetical protein
VTPPVKMHLIIGEDPKCIVNFFSHIRK